MLALTSHRTVVPLHAEVRVVGALVTVIACTNAVTSSVTWRTYRRKANAPKAYLAHTIRYNCDRSVH